MCNTIIVVMTLQLIRICRILRNKQASEGGNIACSWFLYCAREREMEKPEHKTPKWLLHSAHRTARAHYIQSTYFIAKKTFKLGRTENTPEDSFL